MSPKIAFLDTYFSRLRLNFSDLLMHVWQVILQILDLLHLTRPYLFQSYSPVYFSTTALIDSKGLSAGRALKSVRGKISLRLSNGVLFKTYL